MFLQPKLACSFCGKSAAEVSKLVAGPRVFICDSCVTAANRIMNDPTHHASDVGKPEQPIWRRMLNWLRRIDQLAVALPS